MARKPKKQTNKRTAAQNRKAKEDFDNRANKALGWKDDAPIEPIGETQSAHAEGQHDRADTPVSESSNPQDFDQQKEDKSNAKTATPTNSENGSSTGPAAQKKGSEPVEAGKGKVGATSSNEKVTALSTKYPDALIEDIAQICHNVNREYCQSIGDDSQVLWHEAEQSHRDSLIDGVRYAIDNDFPHPALMHANWLMGKEFDGWKYGEVKDLDKKLHPCFVPYDELPPEQQKKDEIFTEAAKVLIAAYDANEKPPSLGELVNGIVDAEGSPDSELNNEPGEKPAPSQATAPAETGRETEGSSQDFDLQIIEIDKISYAGAVGHSAASRIYKLLEDGSSNLSWYADLLTDSTDPEKISDDVMCMASYLAGRRAPVLPETLWRFAAGAGLHTFNADMFDNMQISVRLAYKVFCNVTSQLLAEIDAEQSAALARFMASKKSKEVGHKPHDIEDSNLETHGVGLDKDI